MKSRAKLPIWMLCFLIILLLSGCVDQTTPVETEIRPADTAVIIETSPPTFTSLPEIPSSVATASPTTSPTATATSTSKPVPTVTSTPIPAPTEIFLLPGLYRAGNCAKVGIRYGASFEFCVLSVEIDLERHMVFTVSWKVSGISEGMNISKQSDQSNTNMYVTDNLDNRYDHFDGGGIAYSWYRFEDNTAVTGWFKFPQPSAGTDTFVFHDDDQGIEIKHIKLIERVILFETYSFYDNPLEVTYPVAEWEIVTGEGAYMMSHKIFGGCTLQEDPFNGPQGAFKNSVNIGYYQFDLYGYFDEPNQRNVREYQLRSSIQGLDPDAEVMVYVTLPSDNPLQCIYDVSEVLSSLSLASDQ